MMPDILKNTKIYLICGAPRSGTTFLHDILIKLGIFKGIISEPLIHKSRMLCTNEYRPSIAPAVYYYINPKKRYLKQLSSALSQLTNNFSEGNRLLLKAPHYVYGMNAYKEILGDNVKFLFLNRDILTVGLSMSKHVLIKKQLEQRINRSGDFIERAFLAKKTVDVQFAHPVVYDYAECNWSFLTILERSFLKWHQFQRAFYTQRNLLKEKQYAIANYI